MDGRITCGHFEWDPDAIFKPDIRHSEKEERLFCFGKVNEQVITVRFTLRNNHVRILGAGHWRIGRRIYEEENFKKKIR